MILLQLPIMVINSSFSMFIRGEGNPNYFMKVTILTLVLNAFLDYFFVRHLLWGVKGIAAASLAATTMALFCVLYYFLRKSTVYKFRPFRFSKNTFVKTLLNGSSEFVGEMSLSISMFAYNFVIMKYIGVDGVSAFTIVGYISYISA